jgi:hypothetical protein
MVNGIISFNFIATKARQNCSRPDWRRKARKKPAKSRKKSKAKQVSIEPDLTFLALNKAKWQPCFILFPVGVA